MIVILKGLLSNLSCFFRINANYEVDVGTSTEVNDILSNADAEKENKQSRLTASVLGKIVKYLYGGSVQLVKKGPRENRVSLYKNLKKKTQSPLQCCSVNSQSSVSIQSTYKSMQIS